MSGCRPSYEPSTDMIREVCEKIRAERETSRPCSTGRCKSSGSDRVVCEHRLLLDDFIDVHMELYD
jgi:hypothetical protein